MSSLFPSKTLSLPLDTRSLSLIITRSLENVSLTYLLLGQSLQWMDGVGLLRRLDC